jgi:hypothetical protein
VLVKNYHLFLLSQVTHNLLFHLPHDLFLLQT